MRTAIIVLLCVFASGCLTEFKARDENGIVRLEYSSWFNFKQADYIDITIDPNTYILQIVLWDYLNDPKDIKMIVPPYGSIEVQ